MIESGLEYQTLLSVYKDHTSVVNTLWGILQVVSIALLGFVYQQKHLRSSWLTLAVLSAAFLVFATGNKESMTRSQQVLVAVVDQMKNDDLQKTIPELSGIKSVLQAHNVRGVAVMRRDHFLLSLGVVLLVWLPFVTDRLKGLRENK